jgi:hypothetical protein
VQHKTVSGTSPPRPFSPYINRFLQPDTIVPELSNPQSWNRYSYVTNRPINFNDPTGHRQCEDAGDGACLSEKQVTKKWKFERQKRKRRGEFLSELRELRESGTSGPACGGSNPSVMCNSNVTDDVMETLNQCGPIYSICTPQESEFSYTNYHSSQDFYLAGYRNQINWSQVDWFHVITNGAGIAGDITTFAAALGIVPAAPVAGLTQAIDVVGIASDVLDFVVEKDVSGVSWDIVEYVGRETKAARAIPFVGFGLNIDGFVDALYRGSTRVPIWNRKPNVGPLP